MYAFASFLYDIIYNDVPRTQSHIENSFELVKKLRGQSLDTQHRLISLDVISLFTNVPLELAIEDIGKRWHLISRTTDIPYTEFIAGIRLVLNSNFFKFNDKIYKQTFGFTSTPMDFPLFLILTDLQLVLQDIEERAILIIPIPLPFYFRYVDDILLAALPPSFHSSI